MNAPDMQRVRMSLPYYRENDWECVVLAVAPACHGGSREDALLATVPPDIRVFRCNAIPLKRSRLLGVGNLGLRSWFHLLMLGFRIIRREKIDLVFFSNTQFVTFMLGRIWRRFLGVPYVIDLQDPWRTEAYKGAARNDRPGGWKYTFAHWQAVVLERWSFRRLSGLISVSQGYVDSLRSRYGFLSAVPTEVIGFGASEADLAEAAKMAAAQPAVSRTVSRLVYTGVAGPVMQPALEVFFDGLKAFCRQLNEPRMRIDFLGTSYAAADAAQPSVSTVASRHDVEHLVTEQTARLGHLEAMQQQLVADALLLLGTTDPDYSASKLYPYFLSGRPILAVVLRDSNLEKLLRELACAFVVTFDSTGPNPQTREQLAEFFKRLTLGFPSGSLPARNEQLFQKEFLAKGLTRRQCSLFDRVISTSNPQPPLIR